VGDIRSRSRPRLSGKVVRVVEPATSDGSGARGGSTGDRLGHAVAAAYLCRGSRVKCGLLLAGFVGGEWSRVVGWWVSCARAPRLISVLDRGAVGDMMV